jgi:hypothetical protein
MPEELRADRLSERTKETANSARWGIAGCQTDGLIDLVHGERRTCHGPRELIDRWQRFTGPVNGLGDPVGFLLCGVRSLAHWKPCGMVRRSAAATRLLHDVDELMSQEATPRSGPWGPGAGAEHDVVADGVGARSNCLRRRSGGVIGVDAHGTEVVAKAAPEISHGDRLGYAAT